MQEQNEQARSTQFGRRSVMKAAAWSVPAVSLVAAAPAFAVSTQSGLNVEWGTDTGRLLSLGVLNESTTVGASLLPNGPNYFTIYNNTGGPIAAFTATYTSRFSGGVSVSTSPIRAFALSDASPAAISSTSVTDEPGLLPFYWLATQTLSIPAMADGTSLRINTSFSLAGNRALLALGVLTSNTLSITLNNSAAGSKTDTASITEIVSLQAL